MFNLKTHAIAERPRGVLDLIRTCCTTSAVTLSVYKWLIYGMNSLYPNACLLAYKVIALVNLALVVTKGAAKVALPFLCCAL